MLRALFLSGRGKFCGVLPKISSLSSRFMSVVQSLDGQAKADIEPVETKNELPHHAKSPSKDDSRKFNEKALLDICIEKFDDDLLYLPEVLNKEEWAELIDRGRVVEESIHKLKYEEVLSTGQISSDMRKKLGELNLFRLCIPKEYGGLGYKETACKYIHEIASYCPSIARMLSENEEMGIRVLVKYGTEEQKRKYLPRLASGESLISCAFLEDTSTMLDPRSYLGLAVAAVEDNFFLNGKKNWVYNAAQADLFIVFGTHTAKDDKGFFTLNTLFLVDRTADGVRVHKPMEKKWFRGLDICEVIFDDVKVGPESIIGGFGKGFDVLKEVMQLNKTGATVECSSSMKRLVHDAVDKCNSFKFMDKPMSELKYCECLIGELSSLAYAVESVTYYLAARMDYYNFPDLSLETFMAKIFVSETLLEGLNLYFGVLGKYGYKKGSFVEELVQNAHYYSIMDDTSFDMKLYLMSNAMMYTAEKLKEKYSALVKPMENPLPAIKQIFKRTDMASDAVKPTLDLSMCVHKSLSVCADDLEYCINRLAFLCENHLLTYRRKMFEYDYELLTVADVYINIYALMACIARASRAACLKLPNAQHEVNLTCAFSNRTLMKVRKLTQYSTLKEELENYAELGRKSFTNKSYIAEHPLMRNF